MSRRVLADAFERAAVVAARFFVALLARMPHRVVLAGARALADCAFALRVRRRAMLSNLDRVYGDRKANAEKRRIARSAMRNLFLSAAEMARGSHPRARDEVARTLEFEPRALVDELAADPRGSLLVVAHSGNFDLCGLRFTLDYGRPLAVVMKPLGTPRFDELLVGARRSYGFEVLSAQERGLVLGCARRLREGGVVCMLPDQFARSGGVVVDFLGVPASTHAGPALAALRARVCRIFVVVDTRVRDGAGHVCHVREIRGFEPSEDPRADALRLTQRFCDEMGEVVRAHPESYLWQHRRWRRHTRLGARRRRRRANLALDRPPDQRRRRDEDHERRDPRAEAARRAAHHVDVEAEGVHQTREHERGAEQVEERVSGAVQLEQRHQQQRERHVLDEVRVAPDRDGQIRVAAVAERDVAARAHHADRNLERQEHQTEQSGVDRSDRNGHHPGILHPRDDRGNLISTQSRANVHRLRETAARRARMGCEPRAQLGVDPSRCSRKAAFSRKRPGASSGRRPSFPAA
ncbi:MAG TPA: hypothetical protein VMW19_00080 [Myxococcota bacterium]|nr:hypothetical protein [Myxococcota bacterium]